MVGGLQQQVCCILGDTHSGCWSPSSSSSSASERVQVPRVAEAAVNMGWGGIVCQLPLYWGKWDRGLRLLGLREKSWSLGFWV